MKKAVLLVLTIAAVVCSPANAMAQYQYTEEPEAEGYDLDGFEFALGPALGKEYGFGFAARILAGGVGIEGGIGYTLTLLMIQGDCEYFDLLFVPSYAGTFVIQLKNIKDKMRVLLKLGGGLQDGVGGFAKLGAGFDLYLSRNFLFDFGAGIQIIPGIMDLMEEKADEECGSGAQIDDSAAQNIVQPYIGANAYLRF